MGREQDTRVKARHCLKAYQVQTLDPRTGQGIDGGHCRVWLAILWHLAGWVYRNSDEVIEEESKERSLKSLIVRSHDIVKTRFATIDLTPSESLFSPNYQSESIIAVGMIQQICELQSHRVHQCLGFSWIQRHNLPESRRKALCTTEDDLVATSCVMASKAYLYQTLTLGSSTFACIVDTRKAESKHS